MKQCNTKTVLVFDLYKNTVIHYNSQRACAYMLQIHEKTIERAMALNALEHKLQLIRQRYVCVCPSDPNLLGPKEYRSKAIALNLFPENTRLDIKDYNFEEEFKEIPQLKGYYITRDGILYDSHSISIRTVSSIDNTVPYASIRIEASPIKIHRLVAATYCPHDGKLGGKPSPETKDIVDHIDQDKTNYHADNLRWVSVAVNNSTPADKDSTYLVHDLKTGKTHSAGTKQDIIDTVKSICEGSLISHITIKDHLSRELTKRSLYKEQFFITTTSEETPSLPEMLVSHLSVRGVKLVNQYSFDPLVGSSTRVLLECKTPSEFGENRQDIGRFARAAGGWKKDPTRFYLYAIIDKLGMFDTPEIQQWLKSNAATLYGHEFTVIES